MGDIVERHEAPILGIMTPMHRNRMGCDLIVRVKTERVDSLIRDLKKAEFKVIYREVFPLVSKGKSWGLLRNPESLDIGRKKCGNARKPLNPWVLEISGLIIRQSRSLNGRTDP